MPSLLVPRARRACLPGLLAAVFPFVAPAPAAAQFAATPAGTIVTVATRAPTPSHELAADVVVIGPERIRESTADSLEDLLRREAGVQLSRSGGPGQPVSLFMRGASGAQTLVLIDGVRIGAAGTGIAELEALSLASVERIEVLRGPGSSLYGADALGGVVQITTRRGRGEPHLVLRAAAGGYGAREGSAALSGSSGAFDYSLALADERNRGVSAVKPGDTFGLHNADDDGFHRRSANAQLGWTPRTGERVSLTLLDTRLNAQYDGAEYRPPTYAPDASGDFRTRTHLQLGALRHEANWGREWRSTLRLSSQRSELTSGAAQIDRFDTERDEAEVLAVWRPSAREHWSFALAHQQERVASTLYAAVPKRTHDAAALAYSGRAGGTQGQFDLRLDDDSVYGRAKSGRAGLAWALGNGFKLRTLVGTTFRAPAANELYYPGYGVATLQPERGRSAEVGLDWLWQTPQSRAEFAVTVYQNRVRDLIGYTDERARCPADPAYSYGCAANIGRARLRGGNFSFGLRSGPLGARLGLEFLDAKDLATGARLVRRAAHQETLALDWKQDAWNLGLALLRVGARPEGGRMLAAYTTVDLKAAWTVARGWTAEAKLLNATNRRIEPALDNQALGRQAWLGVRVEGMGL